MFCKKCGKEIADGSEFCQFCGTKQAEEKAQIVGVAPITSKKSNGCLGVIIVIVIVFVFVLFSILILAMSSGSDFQKPTSTNSCASYEELINADRTYKENGIVASSEPTLNSVYVTRTAQKVLKYDDYQTMGYIYACLSSEVKGNDLVWSEIYDEVTHKKIAKYSESYGFKMY